jgi:hypothetical protein
MNNTIFSGVAMFILVLSYQNLLQNVPVYVEQRLANDSVFHIRTDKIGEFLKQNYGRNLQ